MQIGAKWTIGHFRYIRGGHGAMAPARLSAQPASRKISESHLGNKLQAASENSVCSTGPGPKCKPYHRQCSSCWLARLCSSVLRVHWCNGAGVRPACLPYTRCRNQRHGGPTFLNVLCGRVRVRGVQSRYTRRYAGIREEVPEVRLCVRWECDAGVCSMERWAAVRTVDCDGGRLYQR